MTRVVRLALVLALPLLTLVSFPSRAAKIELRLHLSGMIGFAPAPSYGLDVYFLNEFDEFDTGHKIVHTPYFELLDCGLIASPAAEKLACTTTWKKNPDTAYPTSMMDLEKGFRIVLKINGKEPTGPILKEASFTDGVVPIADLAGGNADVFSVRTDATSGKQKRTHALVQTSLRGGKIRGVQSTVPSWRFADAATGVQLRQIDYMASRAVWTKEIESTDTVTVEFWNLDSAPATLGKSVSLKSASSYDVFLSNEPDPEEFCKHFPKTDSDPFGHFEAFYALTAFARKGSGALSTLPKAYFVENPDDVCAEMKSDGVGGRRVDCMMVMFADAE